MNEAPGCEGLLLLDGEERPCGSYTALRSTAGGEADSWGVNLEEVLSARACSLAWGEGSEFGGAGDDVSEWDARRTPIEISFDAMRLG